MNYCSKCGKELKDDALFCVECGTKVENQEKPVENTQPIIVSSAANIARTAAKPKKVASKKVVLWSVIAVVLLVIIIACSVVIPMLTSIFNANKLNKIGYDKTSFKEIKEMLGNPDYQYSSEELDVNIAFYFKGKDSKNFIVDFKKYMQSFMDRDDDSVYFERKLKEYDNPIDCIYVDNYFEEDDDEIMNINQVYYMKKILPTDLINGIKKGLDFDKVFRDKEIKTIRLNKNKFDLSSYMCDGSVESVPVEYYYKDGSYKLKDYELSKSYTEEGQYTITVKADGERYDFEISITK